MGPLVLGAIALGSKLLGGMGGQKQQQSQSPAYTALSDTRSKRMNEESALLTLQRFAGGGDIMAQQPEPWWAGGSEIWSRQRGQA